MTCRACDDTRERPCSRGCFGGADYMGVCARCGEEIAALAYPTYKGGASPHVARAEGVGVAPSAALSWSESELRFAHGDK